jgi:hypothetical protein
MLAPCGFNLHFYIVQNNHIIGKAYNVLGSH